MMYTGISRSSTSRLATAFWKVSLLDRISRTSLMSLAESISEAERASTLPISDMRMSLRKGEVLLTGGRVNGGGDGDAGHGGQEDSGRGEELHDEWIWSFESIWLFVRSLVWFLDDERCGLSYQTNLGISILLITFSPKAASPKGGGRKWILLIL